MREMHHRNLLYRQSSLAQAPLVYCNLATETKITVHGLKFTNFLSLTFTVRRVHRSLTIRTPVGSHHVHYRGALYNEDNQRI